jgi:choline-sulfatase
MRILYIDIDSLRPDHLGCYGYHRDTSPNIDRLAEEGVRFENVYVSDAPCLPSRTALWSGRCGFRTGVVNHGGTAAQPFVDPDRWVTDSFHDTGWMACLRRAGLATVSVSSFAERHAAWHWYAGYNEIYNTGREGMDRADEVTPVALDWIRRRGEEDDWFLHVNYWDPHIPYRTPASYGDPFDSDPLPAWMTEQVWRAGWDGFGPHSPQEPHGYGGETYFLGYPRFPTSIDSMDAVRAWFDGYDTGIRYMDEHIGQLLGALDDAGVLDHTAIVVSADHGENLGELNVWGDHQTADAITCRIPLIVRWPGTGRPGTTDTALHYHFDWAATMIELLGGEVPENWDGQSFAPVFAEGRSEGRDHLVFGQCAHAAQRGVRFDHDGEAYLYMRSYHDGYKMVEPVMVFNLTRDPHELHDLAARKPELVDRGAALLEDWRAGMMRLSTTNVDPLMTVLREGPLHACGMLKQYTERLRATGRAHHARRLAERHPEELAT